jgi:putative DNA primase/helicase
VTAAEIAAALGGAQRSGKWWRCRCPVHASRGATLALRDGKRALIVKCWAGCDPRDVLAELRRRGLIGGDAANDPVRSSPAIDERDRAGEARKTAIACRIWDAAGKVQGSPVADYLRARQITNAPPDTLRYAPALRRRDGSYAPAMVARVDDAAGRMVALHRTWLDCTPEGTWRRLDRASLGPTGGGAVRLASAAETLLIGEGIETCLAAMQATVQPAWAALSTSGLVVLILPANVRTIIILADNDANRAGERAARTAAQRWLAEGRRVRIAMPPEPGSDMADVLAGHAYARVTETADAAA